ncbi:hypothetical protein [Spiroplasma endosymbiont of Atherix ibis]|uniref:hypothetical protein n=1 Tax=Spiroplasma endosymbiont of Atherix ibis TaxID=3066291 RepID=UPI0030CCAE2D
MKLFKLSYNTRKINKYNLSSQHRKYENKLNRNFNSSYFREKFGTNISYLQFRTRTIYLSNINNLYSKKILDYQLNKSSNF